VGHSKQGGNRQVSAGLFQDTLACVHEQDHRVSRGGTGNGVPGVLNVSRAVGQDERAVGGGEVAVGHVNGDALLTFGAQAVGEQCKVCGGQTAAARDSLDRVELIGQDRLGVV